MLLTLPWSCISARQCLGVNQTAGIAFQPGPEFKHGSRQGIRPCFRASMRGGAGTFSRPESYRVKGRVYVCVFNVVVFFRNESFSFSSCCSSWGGSEKNRLKSLLAAVMLFNRLTGRCPVKHPGRPSAQEDLQKSISTLLLNISTHNRFFSEPPHVNTRPERTSFCPRKAPPYRLVEIDSTRHYRPRFESNAAVDSLDATR